jgi:hypothetical protein
MVTPMVGPGGVWSLAVGFLFCFWQKYSAGRIEEVFIFRKFYKFSTFSAICKHNATINFITDQHELVLFPSTLAGDTPVMIYV